MKKENDNEKIKKSMIDELKSQINEINDRMQKKATYNSEKALDADIKYVENVDPEKLRKKIEILKGRIVKKVKTKYKNLEDEMILETFESELRQLEEIVNSIEARKEELKYSLAFKKGEMQVNMTPSTDSYVRKSDKVLVTSEKFYEILFNPESKQIGRVEIMKNFSCNPRDGEPYSKYVGTKVMSKGMYLLSEQFEIFPSDYFYNPNEERIDMSDSITFSTCFSNKPTQSFEIENEVVQEEKKFEKLRSKIIKNPQKYNKPGYVALKMNGYNQPTSEIEVTQAQLIEAGINPELVKWKPKYRSKEVSSTAIAKATKGSVRMSIVDRIKGMFKERNNERNI